MVIRIGVNATSATNMIILIICMSLEKLGEALIIGSVKTAMTVSEKKTLTPDEVAVILGVSRRSIYRYIKSNKLPSLRMLGGWRVPREAVVKLLEKGKGNGR